MVHDTEIHTETSISRNCLHTINVPKCLSTTGNVLWVHFVKVRPTILISTQNLGPETILIIKKTQFISILNITTKHNLSFNADSQTLSILLNLKIADLRPNS